MNNYVLSPEALVMVSGSSKGTQKKYYENGYWYKQNQLGMEGRVEYLVSKLLECTNISDYVKYEECLVNGKPGCRSANFLKEDESFLSFQRLYDIYHGGSLLEQIMRIDSVDERVAFVVDFVEESTGFYAKEYLSKIITLDMITLNVDRHFNNLGVVVNGKKDTYREAPIFDNGAALLGNRGMFYVEDSIEDNIEKAHALPFSASFERQSQACGVGFALDYDKMLDVLDREPDSRERDVLRYQVERYRGYIPKVG
ncbi:MAG: hypothetical protein E7278_09560 [Lachnospiraceae bacterium]|nr:hypothetical protein [Lachnospiraceae bacterium]